MDPATRWKLVPVAVLLPTVLFAAWRIAVALDDPHFAVAEDYYVAAEDHDALVAARRAAAALGWEAELAAPALGAEVVELTLRDGAGAPLAGAAGTLRAFHNAYPGQAREVAWEELGEGRYRAAVALDRPGQWRFDLRFTQGEDAWTAELREGDYAP